MSHNRTLGVRQSHYHVRCDFRTPSAMDGPSIIEGLRRLGIPHEEIAEAIGRDRTAATKMMSGRRNVQVREIEPLAALIAKYERANGDGPQVDHADYVDIEVLPTFAGMGGGGTGDGDRRTALISLRLVRDELRATPADLIMIEVRGNSMEPLFRHGDQLLVDKRDRNPGQPGAFALFDGSSYLVKLVERAPGRKGFYRVFSANDEYSFSEDFVEETETTIIGRPVWFGRRL